MSGAGDREACVALADALRVYRCTEEHGTSREGTVYIYVNGEITHAPSWADLCAVLRERCRQMAARLTAAVRRDEGGDIR